MGAERNYFRKTSSESVINVKQNFLSWGRSLTFSSPVSGKTFSKKEKKGKRETWGSGGGPGWRLWRREIIFRRFPGFPQLFFLTILFFFPSLHLTVPLSPLKSHILRVSRTETLLHFTKLLPPPFWKIRVKFNST